MNNLPAEIKKYTDGRQCIHDSTGMSGSDVFLFDDMVLKYGPADKNEIETVRVMRWLENKLPVPKVIEHTIHDGKSYLLMTRINGKMACDEYYLENPREMIKLIGKVFRMLWSIDVSDCPRTRDTNTELREARDRVEKGMVNTELCEPDTFGDGGFKNSYELLEWLENNRPSYEPVFSHGDLCLPNMLFDNDEIKGLIDLGDSGIGDKWRDIALCYRSLKHNFDGTYGGKVYEDFNADLLFDELDIKPDYDKLRYYILLDELF